MADEAIRRMQWTNGAAHDFHHQAKRPGTLVRPVSDFPEEYGEGRLDEGYRMRDGFVYVM